MLIYDDDIYDGVIGNGQTWKIDLSSKCCLAEVTFGEIHDNAHFQLLRSFFYVCDKCQLGKRKKVTYAGKLGLHY